MLRVQDTQLHRRIPLLQSNPNESLGRAITTFMTNSCNYYYKVMQLGPKNVDVAYQSLKDTVFAYQIWRNYEVYIDDMVMKTRDEKNIVRTYNIY